MTSSYSSPPYFGINEADRFVLKLAPGADVDAVKQGIEDQYGQSRHLQVETTESFRARIRELTNRAFGLLDVLASIGVIVAALGVIYTMLMNVLERRREIGALRSIGMTRAQIIRMILAEAGAMGRSAPCSASASGYCCRECSWKA